jgi:hypothetical protein
MEGSQSGCTSSCEGVHDLPTEQARVHTSSRLLQPLLIPEEKWENISMDFITGLPKVLGRYYIYMVVDRLNQYVHFFVIPTKYNASQVTKLFFREMFILHGLSRNMVSDRDNKFLSMFWQELFNFSRQN